MIADLGRLAGDGGSLPNYPCAPTPGWREETEPEYELRFGADEEYIHGAARFGSTGCRFAE